MKKLSNRLATMALLSAGILLGAVFLTVPAGASYSSNEPNSESIREMQNSAMMPTMSERSGHQTRRDIRCNSNDYRYNRCDTGGRGNVELRKRHSKNQCTRGYSWGTRNRGRTIWVDKGCQATFRITYNNWGRDDN